MSTEFSSNVIISDNSSKDDKSPIVIEIEKIRNRKPIMAICYDFDRTLSPDDMQTFTLIPSFGIDKAEFWTQSNETAKANLMDNNLSWMYQLVKYSKFKNRPLRKSYFQEIGKDVELYNGVTTWFRKMNRYAEKHRIQLEHYIISSGLKEIIEGSSIASYFKRIYASSFLYSADGVAEWSAQAVNYTNKTQYIFRIAKGFLEEYDERVNDSMPEQSLRIPYDNIVYIGDSATDIPCMRLVKSKGGYSIGVFDPQKNDKSKVYPLFNDGRISYFAPADYSSESDLSTYMKFIIDEIAAKERMRTEQKVIALNSSLYGCMTNMKKILELPETQNDDSLNEFRRKALDDINELSKLLNS